MIFRHFADPQTGGHSYLVASRQSREAAIVNPRLSQIEAYQNALSELGLRLAYTLRTDRNGKCADAAAQLTGLTGAARMAPAQAAGAVDSEDVAVPGASVPLGDFSIDVVEVPRGYAGHVAYRVSHYTFAGSSVLIDFHDAPAPANGEPSAILDPAAQAGAVTPSRQPIQNFRSSREGICVERLILEDLHTSLAEARFTPKEERIIRTYVRYMEENDFAHPSASELSDLLVGVDRTAVHVLVHNIRWKQIDLDRLPVVLRGQTSKWLKGLQTRPEFTPHEQEFLGVYLRLIHQNAQPPSGPEIAAELGRERSVQWVRKRAHTIRRKQREYKMPELILSRKSPAPPAQTQPARGSFSKSSRSHRRPPNAFGFDMQYGA